jgi:hypothetical protein
MPLKQPAEANSHDKQLRSLEGLMADLGSATGHGNHSGQLLLEHLAAARRYRLGAMHNEYGFCLQQANDSVNCLPELSARKHAKEVLGGLIAAQRREKR